MARGVGAEVFEARANEVGVFRNELAFRHVEVDAELRAELAHQVNEVADSEGGAAVATVVEERKELGRY